MPLADYFQKDLGTNWCKAPDVQTVFKVNNNGYSYIVLALFQVAFTIFLVFWGKNHMFWSFLIFDLWYFRLAFICIKEVKREGEAIVISQFGGGSKTFQLSDIESVKAGYKYSYWDCKLSDTLGENFQDEASNVLITFKRKMSGCFGYTSLLVSIADGKVDEFTNSLVDTEKV